MAKPTVNGGKFTPDPPQPSQPFQLLTDVIDADVGAPPLVLKVKAEDQNGVAYEGTLLTQADALTVGVTPADATSPPVARDQNNPQLFYGVAPATFTKLSYTIAANDTAGNTDALDVNSQDYVPPVIPPNPNPVPGGTLIADLGDLAGDPDVAPIKMGNMVGGASGDPYGSSAIAVIKDPTGKLGGNVVRVKYRRDNPAANPDVNRAFTQQPGMPQVGLGETLLAKVRLLLPDEGMHITRDPVTGALTEAPERVTGGPREADQRKLLYFTAKQLGAPYNTYSSSVVVKREGNSLKTTYNNPMYGYPNGGNTKQRVHSFAPGILTFGEPHDIEWQWEMNTEPLTPGLLGDGRFMCAIDGAEVADIPNVVIMDSYGAPSVYHLLKDFEFGDQWQSSPVDKSVLWQEDRYYKVVQLTKV